MDDGDPLLTVVEVSAYLRVGEESIRRWLRSGKLVGINLDGGAGWRIRRSEVSSLLAKRSRPTELAETADEPRDDPTASNGHHDVGNQDVLVTCATKVAFQNPHAGITHLGDGERMWTRAEVIDAIQTGSHRFFTISEAGRADVRVYDGPFGEYLRTRTGDKWDDTLLTLAECAGE